MGNEKKTEQYQGEPPSEELANGPIEKRHCTDVLCCLIFAAFWVGFFIITIIALAEGHPQKIGRGYDIDGKVLLDYHKYIRQHLWLRRH